MKEFHLTIILMVCSKFFYVVEFKQNWAISLVWITSSIVCYADLLPSAVNLADTHHEYMFMTSYIIEMIPLKWNKWLQDDIWLLRLLEVLACSKARVELTKYKIKLGLRYEVIVVL